MELNRLRQDREPPGIFRANSSSFVQQTSTSPMPAVSSRSRRISASLLVKSSIRVQSTGTLGAEAREGGAIVAEAMMDSPDSDPAGLGIYSKKHSVLSKNPSFAQQFHEISAQLAS
jgi:hypothetical protein